MRDMFTTYLGHKFSSGVDSEVFVHMLEELIRIHKDRYKAVVEFFKRCRGNVLV